jgi:hypothetical protein
LGKQLVTAYTYLSYDTQNPGDIFEQTRISADLALLVDVLTIVTNQDINTSVVISTEPVIDSFVGGVIYKSKSVDDFLVEIRGLKHQSNASCLNGNDPIRINDNSSYNYQKRLLKRFTAYCHEYPQLINTQIQSKSLLITGGKELI